MKTYLVNNKYKIKADSAVQAAKLAKIVDSRKDSENIKLEQLTKGDVFYDPHYQEKCKIIEIDDDQYRVQSLTTGKTYWKNKRASVIKDAAPIEVEKVVYSIDDIKVLEYTYDNRKMWIVTSNYNGEKTYYGGGTIEFTKSDAIQTAKNFATIHRLEKKYGTVEAHKRYVKGYKDAVVDKNKIEQIISSREFNFVKEDGNTQTYKFIGQNPYDKEYHFKELSKTLPGNVGLALSGDILTVSYRDSAIKDYKSNVYKSSSYRIEEKLPNGYGVAKTYGDGLFYVFDKNGDVIDYPSYAFKTSAVEAAKRMKDFDSMKKDSENSVIEYLTEEEEKAVEDYKKAIQSTSNPTLLKMFQHILQEELEHIEELDGVKNEKGIQDDASLTSEIKEYFSENLPNIKITNIAWSGKQALIKTTNDDQAYKALKRDYAYNTVERNSNGIMIYFD